jgi:hypothetical protein
VVRHLVVIADDDAPHVAAGRHGTIVGLHRSASRTDERPHRDRQAHKASEGAHHAAKPIGYRQIHEDRDRH